MSMKPNGATVMDNPFSMRKLDEPVEKPKEKKKRAKKEPSQRRRFAITRYAVIGNHVCTCMHALTVLMLLPILVEATCVTQRVRIPPLRRRTNAAFQATFFRTCHSCKKVQAFQRGTF